MNKTKVFAPFLVFWILTFCGCSSGRGIEPTGDCKGSICRQNHNKLCGWIGDCTRK